MARRTGAIRREFRVGSDAGATEFVGVKENGEHEIVSVTHLVHRCTGLMTADDDVLVCEFALRPRGAASLFDVAPAVLQVSREPDSVVVDFDPSAAAIVREYTAAERLCCPTVTWNLEEGSALRLRVCTTPGRLQTLEEMFATARSLT